MKILVAPDSFKGSMTADRFCRAAAQAAKRVFSDISVTQMPLSDGGEGTASLMTDALGGILEQVTVEGPFGKVAHAKIGYIGGGRCAIIESAQAIGLNLAGRRANPIRTSSFGVGQMISHATSKGASRVILTLGGSSTNDLGAGMLSAMGVSFVDICGNHFTPVGGSLERVENIEFNQAFSKYREVDFTLLCDVKNPLLGENGCAAVFAPQKGASPAEVKRLENGARKFAQTVKRITGRDESNTPGAGAAGGIAFGAMSFLGAEVKSGIDSMLEMYDFDRAVTECDIIITGEGRFDRQSFMGKAVGGVLERRNGKPVIIFCGSTDGTPVPDGVTVIPIGEGIPLEEAMANAPELLIKAAEGYFRKM